MARTLRSCVQHGPVPRPRVKTAAVAALLLIVPASAEAGEKRARIVVYHGFGTPARARLWGRVLEDKEHGEAKRHESTYRKLRRNLSDLESDEIPNAEIEIEVLGRKHRVTSDKEGLFRLDLKGPLKAGSHPVAARALGDRPHRTEPGQLFVLPARPGVLVISDIDDTVLQTGVTDKRKMLKQVLLKGPHDLKTFPGAPALYQALSARGHPIVFVSGSPNNFYTRLQQFFSLNKFPSAPLLLKDFGSDALTEQVAYKQRRIAEALELLPGYKMLLVGDSGEKDPEVYAEVARKHPGRVVLSAIHRVTDEQASSARFSGQSVFTSYRALAETLRERGLLSKEEAGGVK